MEVVLGMHFLAFSNADFQFDAKEFTWKTYTIIEVLPTTSWVEFIDKREFAKIALDKNLETFVVYVLALEAIENSIYPSQTVQIVAL